MGDNSKVTSRNHFESNANNSFNQFWNNQDFTDITLATEDNQQIKAHKVILSSHSQFFQNILTNNPHQNVLLYLKDIRYKELEMVIKFIYLGECDVEQDDLEDFLAAGKYLKVSGLMEDIDVKCFEEHVIENTSPNTQQQHEVTNSIKTDIYDTNWINSPPEEIIEEIFPYNQHKVKTFECGECKSLFATKSALIYHKQSKHMEVRFRCDQCDHESTKQSHLIIHKQSKHLGIKYHCDQCDGTYTTMTHLTTHIKSQGF